MPSLGRGGHYTDLRRTHSDVRVDPLGQVSCLDDPNKQNGSPIGVALTSPLLLLNNALILLLILFVLNWWSTWVVQLNDIVQFNFGRSCIISLHEMAIFKDKPMQKLMLQHAP